MTDADREKLIDAYLVILKLEEGHDAKLAAAQRMGELIGGRSPEVVREMEASQGLR